MNEQATVLCAIMLKEVSARWIYGLVVGLLVHGGDSSRKEERRACSLSLGSPDDTEATRAPGSPGHDQSQT